MRQTAVWAYAPTVERNERRENETDAREPCRTDSECPYHRVISLCQERIFTIVFGDSLRLNEDRYSELNHGSLTSQSVLDLQCDITLNLTRSKTHAI